jgi:hypothetical protein
MSTTITTKRLREEDDFPEAFEDNKRVQVTPDPKFIEDVHHLLKPDSFEEDFFSDKEFIEDEDDGLDPDDVMALGDSQSALRAFLSCINGDSVAVPTGGLPDTLTDLEKDFVECVIAAIEDGALEKAEDYLTAHPPALAKTEWWPLVATRFYYRCCDVVEQFEYF